MIAAIVPAAGLSSRMGRPKPLLVIEGRTLIARVVEALREGGAGRVIVVAPPSDRTESAAIALEAERAGAEVLVPPVQPPDMRASIEAALDRLGSAEPPEAILLTPADQPGIGPDLVRLVIRSGRDAAGAIVVPMAGEKRGHPVYLPWSVAQAIRLLPEGRGVNALLDGSSSVWDGPAKMDQVVPNIDPPPYPPPQGGRDFVQPSPLVGEGRVGGGIESQGSRVQPGWHWWLAQCWRRLLSPRVGKPQVPPGLLENLREEPRRRVVSVPIGATEALLDLDTPDDYRRLTGRELP